MEPKDFTAETTRLLMLSGLDELHVMKLNELGYFGQPASRSFHLNEYGGLAIHSVNVTRRLVKLTEALGVKWPRSESPYLVGMLHDLVKCRCYRLKEEVDGKPKWEYIQPVYPGHGACSVAIAAELGIQLVRDEIVAITYHMGKYGVDRGEYTDNELDSAVHWHGQQIIATHTADWYAARVDEEEGAK